MPAYWLSGHFRRGICDNVLPFVVADSEAARGLAGPPIIWFSPEAVAGRGGRLCGGDQSEKPMETASRKAETEPPAPLRRLRGAMKGSRDAMEMALPATLKGKDGRLVHQNRRSEARIPSSGDLPDVQPNIA